MSSLIIKNQYGVYKKICLLLSIKNQRLYQKVSNNIRFFTGFYVKVLLFANKIQKTTVTTKK